MLLHGSPCLMLQRGRQSSSNSESVSFRGKPDNISSAFQFPGFFTAAILGKGKENLTALSLEKRCQCQPLKNVIKANEKRVEDIFMGIEYCAWKFYGNHRKLERQSHS